MAFRSSSMRTNYLSNNENAHKAIKEVTSIVSGPTLRRAALGDRTNIVQKSVSDASKLKPFKKPIVAKPKNVTKKTTKQENEVPVVPPPPSVCQKPAEVSNVVDSTMVSLDANNTVLPSSQRAAVPQDMSCMSVQEAEPASVVRDHQCDALPEQDIDEEIAELSEAFSSKLLTVKDIDAGDKDNPQLVSQYVNEIYAYMRALEDKHTVKKRYLDGCLVTSRMRSILVDWIVQVHIRFSLMQETLFLTISILDRYLQLKPNTPKEELQLVGVTAMFIASKYEEMYCPEIQDFVLITDKAYTKRQIRSMEVLMLKTLDFYISFPLPLHFLRRNSKAGQVDGRQHTLAKYLLELCLPEYTMCHYKASEIGAAALCLALKLTSDKCEWSDTLLYYSAYTEAHLTPIMCKLAQCITRSRLSKQQAIPEKYQSSKFMKISELPQLKGQLIRNLSEKAAAYS